MEVTSPTTQPAPEARQPWEEPQIVLERLLLVSAQEGPVGGPPQSTFIGPLGTSGGSGTCA